MFFKIVTTQHEKEPALLAEGLEKAFRVDARYGLVS